VLLCSCGWFKTGREVGGEFFCILALARKKKSGLDSKKF
jgi:hypothetical protein